MLLGLWNEDLAGLEKNASEATSRHRAAKSALTAFKKLRDSGALADPDSVRAAYEQKQREHLAAAERRQKADMALKPAVGERGRLVALHQAAEAQRRKTAKQAVAAHGKLNGATAEHARAECELAALHRTGPQDCTCCGQLLPDREPGLCRQCGQQHEGADDRSEQRIAAARAKVERLRLRLRGLEEASVRADAEAADADTAAGTALTTRDAYDEGHLQPARRTAQLAEKEAHGLSRDVAQLKERLESADYINAQEQVIKAAKEQMETAQTLRDAAVAAHNVRRKEVTDRWSEFFLARLRQINPAVETAYVDPAGFTTRVKEKGEADKTFVESSVGGSPRVATNVALLLSLRDLGHVDPAVRVPPLLIIDSPLSGLGFRKALDETLLASGLADATGRPLRYQPHDFRRIFVTDAIMSGLPPHIAQVICGHKTISTTMNYKAVYPTEAIEAHRAFIARRRALRPSEEYRTPTSEEWDAFLAHFEKRKLSVGTCARAFGTQCVHEHACIRCSMLRPEPEQRARLAEIRDNLIARIAEAEREGWLGEVDGLHVSLAGAEDKLVQLDSEAARRSSAVSLGMPTFGQIAARTEDVTTPTSTPD